MPIILDESTQPLGWVRNTTASTDIAVISSVSAEVRFVIGTRAGTDDAVSAELRGIRVAARDSSSKEWVGRMTSPLVATSMRFHRARSRSFST
ncbi:MAG: hypothetical protein ABI664_05180 [bacterium]